MHQFGLNGVILQAQAVEVNPDVRLRDELERHLD
jgi:hypothetical protein